MLPNPNLLFLIDIHILQASISGTFHGIEALIIVPFPGEALI